MLGSTKVDMKIVLTLSLIFAFQCTHIKIEKITSYVFEIETTRRVMKKNKDGLVQTK